MVPLRRWIFPTSSLQMTLILSSLHGEYQTSDCGEKLSFSKASGAVQQRGRAPKFSKVFLSVITLLNPKSDSFTRTEDISFNWIYSVLTNSLEIATVTKQFLAAKSLWIILPAKWGVLWSVEKNTDPLVTVVTKDKKQQRT